MVLEKVLHTLTDSERQIVMLHALSGLKHREVADLLGIPQATAISRYNRALESCAIRWEVTILTDKELLEQLRTEVVAETPDCWSAILARVQAPAQQPEEEKIVPMPERGRRRGAWKRWVAAAAVFFLAVLGGGLYATQVPGGVATLDANPSIELTVNKLGRVLSARVQPGRPVRTRRSGTAQSVPCRRRRTRSSPQCRRMAIYRQIRTPSS